ncbi:hypothetical protein [Vibrio alginolyticus]|uniref:hypothetical protein n=1 Tax=Vibrio alginolyticus TaxID=663 RepID=UPI003747935A
MKTIAVSERASFWKLKNVKASIVAFDQIYIPHGQSASDRRDLEADMFNKSLTYDDIEYLESQGIVTQNPIVEKAGDIVEISLDEIAAYNKVVGGVDEKTLSVFGNILERKFIEELLNRSDDMFIPASVLTDELPFLDRKKQVSVHKIILENLPIISEDVPLDEVVSFKKEYAGEYKSLMLWASKKATGNEEKLRVEELAEMIVKCRKHFEAGELKFTRGRFEILMQSTQLLMDIGSLNFGSVAKTLASIRQSKADLMLHELNNDYRPLSYLIKAQDKFG